MKFPQLFVKTPKHKRFSFAPRFYNQEEEDRKEREERIRREVQAQMLSEEAGRKALEDEEFGYRKRIAGSFRQAKKTVTPIKDPSAALPRLLIVTILTVGLIAYLQYGRVAIYGVFLAIIPVYAYLKFRNTRR